MYFVIITYAQNHINIIQICT